MDQIPQQRHNLSGRALRDTRRYCFCQLPKTFYQRHASDRGIEVSRSYLLNPPNGGHTGLGRLTQTDRPL